MSPGVRRRAAAGLFVLLWLALSSSVPAATATPASAPDDDERYRAGSLQDRLDVLVHDGFERPAAALTRLDLMSADEPATPAARRLLLQARASIEAQAGQAAKADEHAEQLLLLSRESNDPLAGAAAGLVRALIAETAGQPELAGALAQPTLDVYQASCPELMAPAASRPAARTRCDYRSAWRALHVMARRSMSLGQMVPAQHYFDSALALATHAGDAWRKTLSLGAMTYTLAVSGRGSDADRVIGEARRAAAAVGDPVLQAQVLSSEARVVDARGDRPAAARLTEEALALARRAQAPRREAMLLANLSDLYAKLNRPEQALRAADEALATVRVFNDRRAERVLINNAGLAKIGLGRIAEGKQDLAHLLDLWRDSGALADQATTLREFDEALADAGDARGALELYHREREATTEVVRRSREAARKEIQTRYDAEAKQRSIDLLNRDNALKSEALASHTLWLKNWATVAGVLALAAAGAMLLYRRVRSMQRQLEATEVRLREQSQRDALTNLANRRHLHAVMDTPDSPAFEGAILLIDIDHFKLINDRHGHAAGDEVLVEFGRRLNQTVRADDLVVRWGGEEFLIIANGLTAQSAHQLAARVLARITDEPFRIQGHELRVTASIGYGRFPLSATRRDLPWQQGVNLVDKALYSAKSEGRNRAMGLVPASEAVPAGLRRIAAEPAAFEVSGPMELLQTCGAAA
jgi:diguanylate cyclase (GGDEF)-like protein